MLVGEARAPEGMRLYAIGDIHGCEEMLVAVHTRIADDLAARPVSDHRIIHIGDYADRGPDSAGVISRLAALSLQEPRVLCLRGNHDQMLLEFMAEPDERGGIFLRNGGKQTLRFYGVGLRSENYVGIARQLGEQMPAMHRAFLDGLLLSVRFGDYFFCHAGIRPGEPLETQTGDDLMWIREEFLGDTRDHGAVIVHGHTVTATQLATMLASRKAGLKDFDLVDVRETGEHDIVKIDGSVLIPQGRILAGEAWAELPQDRDIVFHCKAGTRSANVLEAARKAGYQRVSHLDGGILAWVRDVEPHKPVY